MIAGPRKNQDQSSYRHSAGRAEQSAGKAHGKELSAARSAERAREASRFPIDSGNDEIDSECSQRETKGRVTGGTQREEKSAQGVQKGAEARAQGEHRGFQGRKEATGENSIEQQTKYSGQSYFIKTLTFYLAPQSCVDPHSLHFCIKNIQYSIQRYFFKPSTFSNVHPLQSLSMYKQNRKSTDSCQTKCWRVETVNKRFRRRNIDCNIYLMFLQPANT